MILENELLIDTRYSAWQNRQVRTIIVNSRSKLASQRSISAAISAAKPYDRIELVGGEYFETVSIPFPIELVASEGEDVRISFRGTCLTAAVDCGAFVSNIEFHSKGKQRTDFAVVLTAGTAELSQCRISSCLISGKATPTLHRCQIRESLNGVGLRVADGGGGVVDSCDIAHHACVCVEVDTVGDLTVRSSTIVQPNSSMTAVSVQAVMSSATKYTDMVMASDGRHPGICCRSVRFSDNRIFVKEGIPYADAIATQAAALGLSTSSGVSGGAAQPIPVLSTFGEACCALISHDAQPLFERNEFSEGNIGIIFERLGSAVLRGNVLRLQRKCGVFFLLPEVDTHHHTDEWSQRSSVRISDSNFFDRCRIGIDVQCGLSGTRAIHADAAPSCHADRSGHSWLNGLDGFTAQRRVELCSGTMEVVKSTSNNVADGDYPIDVARCCGSADSMRTTSSTLSEFLLTLVEDVMLAHPKVSKHVRRDAQGIAGTPSGYLTTTHTGATFGFLTALLGDPSVYRASLRREDNSRKNARLANTSLEALRGGFGIHIVDARFINCSLCGVRFGTNGRGLIDACDFDRCGSSAILVESGSCPMIVGCSFQNNGECAILSRTYANPLIVCNAFESSSSGGILMSAFSRGLILGNVISGCESFGVDVSDASTTLVAHNFITRNKEGGLRAKTGSKPFVLSNQFTGNFGEQIHVSAFAAPWIACNIVISGGSTGILCTDCGCGHITGNRITFQTNEGVRVELDADPLVEDNIIANNKGHGVFVRNNGGGTFVANSFDANELYNIRLEEGGTAVIRGNAIIGGLLGGVAAAEEGTGLVEKNKIHKNGLANVVMSGPHTDPQILCNDVGECYSGVGILCEEDCRGVIIGNVIHRNKSSGILSRTRASPLVQRNKLIHETAGVVFTHGGRGVFENNSIYDLHGTGIIVQERGNPVVRHNTITSCALSGFLITPEASGELYQNTVSHCGIGVINGHAGGGSAMPPVEPHPPSSDTNIKAGKSASRAEEPVGHVTVSSTILRNNSIRASLECGVLCESGANATFTANDIVGNGAFGILCDVSFRADRLAHLAAAAKRRALMRESADSGRNPHAGLQWWELSTPGASNGVGGGNAVFERNSISQHSVANIAALQHGSNTFRVHQNRITESPCGILVRNSSMIFLISENTISMVHEGLAFESNGRGHVLKNTIQYCSFCCVYIASGGDPLVESNKIDECGATGILCDSGSRGVVRENSIARCVVGVALVTSPSSAGSRGASCLSLSSTTLVERNSIHEHELHGVLLLQSEYGFPVRQLRRVTNGATSTEQTTSRPSTPSHAPTSKHEWQAELQKFFQSVGDGERSQPIVRDNKIFRNRFCGVFRERFQMLDLPDEDPRRLASVGPDVDGVLPSAAVTPDKQTASHHKRPHQTVQSPLSSKHNRRKSTGTSRAGSESRGDGVHDAQTYDTEPHLHQRALSLPSLISNDIYENSFGIIVGQEMDLFVLRCRVHHNAFFGLMVRSTGCPEVQVSSIEENGLAGVYCARFSSGLIQDSSVSANNFLCRDPTLLDQPRSIATFVASLHFASLVTSDDAWVATAAGRTQCSAEGLLILTESVTEMVNAHRQMTTTCDVHLSVLDGACVILSDVVAAPSNALSLASSILPNPYYASAASSIEVVLASAASNSASDNAPTCSSSRGTTNTAELSPPTRSRRSALSLASTIADQYATTPVPDGGVGLWIEEGAQIRVTGSTITKHRHTGVLFSRGLLSHHHIIRQTYAEHSRGEFSLTPKSADLSSSSSYSPFGNRFASPNPGVLFTHQTLINTSATTGADMAHVLDRTATYLDATSMNAGLSSMTSSPAKGGGAQGSPGAALLSSFGGSSNSCPLPYNVSGAPLLQRNVIADNAGDGIRIQLFHAMIASNAAKPHADVATHPTTSDPPRGPKKTPAGRKRTTSIGGGGNECPEVVVVARPRGNVPLPHMFDSDMATLQFSLVIEENEIRGNGLRGVLCEHISEINCSSAVTTRATLIERFEEQAAQVRSNVEGVLRRGSNADRAVRLTQCARLIVEAGRLSNARHANIRVNQFAGNTHSHIECVSRYVAYTGDKHRTLLHVDAQLDPVASGTMFGFSNLMRVALVSDLTSCPPPGLCLIDENTFTDAAIGIHCSGILPSQVTRVRANVFTKHHKAGIFVDGPRAAVCAGDLNVFEDNHVGIYFNRSVGTGFVPATAAASASAATNSAAEAECLQGATELCGGPSRIFKNKFRNNVLASILVETLTTVSSKDALLSKASAFEPSVPQRLLLPPPVIFKNTFEAHDAGSAGIVVSGPMAAAWVTTNTFHRNVVGLLATHGCGNITSSEPGSGALSSTRFSAARTLLVEHNAFDSNVVGLLASSGASAALLTNSFLRNAWCGAAIVDEGTSIAVRDCIFCNHANPNYEFGIHNEGASLLQLEMHTKASTMLRAYLVENPLGYAKVCWTLCTSGGGPLPPVIVALPPPLSLMSAEAVGRDSPAVDWVCAGCVVDPVATVSIENTLFSSNEVGLDLMRDVVPSWCTGYGRGVDVDHLVEQVAPRTEQKSTSKIQQCAFRGNLLAGTHVRGHPARAAVYHLTEIAAEADHAALGAASPQASIAKKSRAAHSSAAVCVREHAPSILLERCVYDECTTAQRAQMVSASERRPQSLVPTHTIGSDIVCRWFGHAEFIGCVLHNVVRSADDGYGVLRSCVIASRSSFSHIGVVIAAGGRTSFVDNIIRDKDVCIRALSLSHGLTEQNLLTNASIGIESEPNCSTTFRRNTIALMSDCGATLRGGFVLQNTFTASPVGVVTRGADTETSHVSGRIPPEKSPAAIEASSAVVNYELKFSENTVHSCDGDGVLVGGGGLLEANHIFNNKTNINVVCCPASKDDSIIPRITQNFVFDGQFGVLLANNSVCFLSNNDVFDNAVSGVVCQEGATGLVEGNRISSSQNHGALEISPGCPCQIHHNTVRNQFSPAYNKGLANQRVKTLQKDSQKFAAVLGDADEKMSVAQADSKILSTAMTNLFHRLTHDGATTMGGLEASLDFLNGGAAVKPARSLSLGRGRALSFTRFDDATAPLAGLRQTNQAFVDGNDRNSDAATATKTQRSQSAFGRVRSLQQLRKDATGGDARGSATAANVLRGASKERKKVAAQQESGGSGQNSRSTTPTSKSKRSTRGPDVRVLLHAFHGRIVTSAVDAQPLRGSAQVSPQTTPRTSSLHDRNAQVTLDALNLLRGAFQRFSTASGSPATVMATDDASSVVSAIKSQVPSVAVFLLTDPLAESEHISGAPVLPPLVLSPTKQRSDGGGSTTHEKVPTMPVLHASDEASIPKISRLLHTLHGPNGSAPLRPILIVHDSYALAFGTPGGAKARTGPVPPLHKTSFVEFATQSCIVVTFASLDDLEDAAIPKLLQMIISQSQSGGECAREEEGRKQKPPMLAPSAAGSRPPTVMEKRVGPPPRSRSSSPAIVVSKPKEPRPSAH